MFLFDVELVDEKILDICCFKEIFRDIFVYDLWFVDNVLGRNMSDLLEIVIVFVLFVFIRIEEDFVWLNFVVKFVSFLMVDLIYIDEDMLDVCILLELSDFLFLNDLRLVGRVLKRVVMEYLYVFLVIVLFVFKLLNVEVV